MKLSKPVIALVVTVILLFAVAVGLGAIILKMQQGNDVVAALETGFIAAGSAIGLGCALLGIIAVMS